MLSQEEARLLNHGYIGTEHLLLGLIHEGHGVAAEALASLDISLDAVRAQVEETVGRGEQTPAGHIPFTPRAKKVLEFSLREALQLGHNYVGTEHLLLGMIREGEGVAAQVLVAFGADLDRVRHHVTQLLAGYEREESTPGVDSPDRESDLPDVLDQYGRSLTQAARQGRSGPVIGRDQEIERIMQVLSRRAKNNPVLIGEAGVGKTTVVEGLAQRIVSGDVPRILQDKHIYTLHPADHRGDAGERLGKLLKEIRARGDIILLLDLAADGALDVVDRLRPVLARGDLQTISVATPDQYRTHIESDVLMEPHLQPIAIDEPTVEDAVDILKVLRDQVEAHHRVAITDGALVTAVQLAQLHVTDRLLPHSAIDLIDEAGARRGVTQILRPELLDLETEIARVKTEKESFIDAMDFEKAAQSRDEEHRLIAARAALEKKRTDGDLDLLEEVDEDLIAQVVADLTGLPMNRVRRDVAVSVPGSETAAGDGSVKEYTLLGDLPRADPASDVLGSQEMAERIASMIQRSTGSSPFVVAIDGGWGMGKSTLLMQIETALESGPLVEVVRYNAWTAHGDDALEGIIKSVLLKLDANRLRFMVRKVAGAPRLRLVSRIIAGIALRFLGLSRLVDEIWSRAGVDAQAKNELRDAIQGMLRDWSEAEPSRGRRVLVVSIDDLDRCSDATILQVCEAVKLYLDAPGIIFLLACDISVLARGVAAVTDGRDGLREVDGARYLEKIVQVHHRLPGYGDEKIKALITHYADTSGTSHLFDDDLIEILSARSDRNPRRLKRIINSFVMEQQLNPAWREPPLGSAQLLAVVVLRHLYPSFYQYIADNSPEPDPVGYFLDYAKVKRRASHPPPASSAWWSVLDRVFRLQGMSPLSRADATALDVQRHVEAVQARLPRDFPSLAADESFIALLRSLGSKTSRTAVYSELLRQSGGADLSQSH